MLARIHKSMKEKDEGFTLIELLVVMIIIGILAAIAIPVFLSQRAKARDSATKSDVSTIGKEFASYYVDGTSTVFVGISGPATAPVATLYQGTSTSGTVITTVNLSSGTALRASAAQNTTGQTSANWCIALTNSAGATKDWKYSAAAGLQDASGTGCPGPSEMCSGAVAPATAPESLDRSL